MDIKTLSNHSKFNRHVNHPLQSFEWGEFRKKTGVKVIRRVLELDEKTYCFQLTIHKIPKTPWTIGYLPKSDLPNKIILEELKKIGNKEKCIFIQLEPNIENIKNYKLEIENLGLKPSARPLFTKYTFELDLTKNEEELLKNMHSKTRYNIRVAKKHNVNIEENNSDEAFEKYLKLTEETTKRQNFYAHTKKYHELMWETFRLATLAQGKPSNEKLTAHLLLAKYKDQTLAAWILFVFKDKLYYPYGASSNNYRETMSSNLIMWEAIRLGKKLGLKKFDMWGALGPNPNINDPWYGFHRFKEGYGGRLAEFIGSYDLIINPNLYIFYTLADKLRWILLRFKTRL